MQALRRHIGASHATFHANMGKQQATKPEVENDADVDESLLSALTRTSFSPPSKVVEDDGKMDLKLAVATAAAVEEPLSLKAGLEQAKLERESLPPAAPTPVPAPTVKTLDSEGAPSKDAPRTKANSEQPTMPEGSLSTKDLARGELKKSAPAQPSSAAQPSSTAATSSPKVVTPQNDSAGSSRWVIALAALGAAGVALFFFFQPASSSSTDTAPELQLNPAALAGRLRELPTAPAEPAQEPQAAQQPAANTLAAGANDSPAVANVPATAPATRPSSAPSEPVVPTRTETAAPRVEPPQSAQQAAPQERSLLAAAPTEAPARPAAQPAGALGSVLDEALSGRRPAAPPAPVATGALPETPSQADVRRVLAALTPQIRTCAGEQVGTAPAVLMVRSDGSVVTASVAGAPFGNTPQGECMGRVLRGARFPAFRNSSFQVRYPFAIR